MSHIGKARLEKTVLDNREHLSAEQFWSTKSMLSME